MASKSVVLKGGSHGLEHPEPTRHRRNKSPSTNARAAAAARKRAAAESPEPPKTKPTKRRAVTSAAVAAKRDGRAVGTPVSRARARPEKVETSRKALTVDESEVVSRAKARPGKKPRGSNVDTSKRAMTVDESEVTAAGTPRRHAKRNTSRMTAVLEESATGRRSRKSTRKSANHTKPSQLTRRTQRALYSPEARAARGA